MMSQWNAEARLRRAPAPNEYRGLSAERADKMARDLRACFTEQHQVPS